MDPILSPGSRNSQAREARAAGEAAMRRVLDEEGRETPVRGRIADKPVQSLRVVTAAVGRRVVCRGTGVRADDVARGYYQNDGRILDDASRLVLKPLDFAAAAGNTSKRPFATITLESEPECSLHSLAEAHGVTTVAAESNPQNLSLIHISEPTRPY